MNGDQNLHRPQARRADSDRATGEPAGAGAAASPARRDFPGAVGGAVPGRPVLAGRCVWAGEAFDVTPGVIGDARRFVTGFLAQLHRDGWIEVSPRLTEIAQLVVSELVTNARKYAPGPCAVEVELSGPVLEITVSDTSPVLPLVLPADPARVGGHGLEIVTAVCEDFAAQREPSGKRVKARVPTGPAAE
ncbi:ATP-binding protein [Streptomyces sp. Wb2n-11]|uniref:ATP-binding protein n=1 Tax=Streptomyces sp. Wb2n-11 TaxID=1030533 RepID=UPI0021000446|nr:ATP-binding protein [Streptomyces sp. Wb2n-11]